MSKLDRSTAVPLGIAVSVTLFLTVSAVKISNNYVRLEDKVNLLERSYQVQAGHLGELRNQIEDLDRTIIKLTGIIEKLEEKLSD